LSPKKDNIGKTPANTGAAGALRGSETEGKNKASIGLPAMYNRGLFCARQEQIDARKESNEQEAKVDDGSQESYPQKSRCEESNRQAENSQQKEGARSKERRQEKSE
jgi:hypothetical protein